MLHPDDNTIGGLRGIRILDFTWAGAGPFATEQLCRMGADVVKVEAASRPDLLRVANIAYNWGPGGLESNSCFNDINAGKRSISLDLKTPAGREIALRLAREADVVCDNMRPGKMEALGLGYEQLRAINPRIICCSVSATGRVRLPNGEPQPDVPGYAPVFWAEGGGASVTGFPEGEPAYFRAPTDMNAATYFAVGILAALIARESTGVGARVDCSAVETVVCCVGDEVLAASLGLPAGGLRGNDRPGFSPNDAFPCAGPDAWIGISVANDAQWASLCGVLELDSLVADPTWANPSARADQSSELYPLIAAATQGRQAKSLERDLQAVGVPAAAFATLAELLEDPGLLQRGFWRVAHHPMLGEQRVGGLAANMTPAFPSHDHGGPLLGEHTADVLGEWLGLTRPELEDLQKRGTFEAWRMPAMAAQ
ncbi:MAG: CaiB/BaiF CoA transferase family protein [Pigmentiphaga sp.]